MGCGQSLGPGFKCKVMSKRSCSSIFERAEKIARTDDSPASGNLRVANTVELKKLRSVTGCKSQWRLWGPYLSERQWGTVREDHSVDGNCWDHVSYIDATYYCYQSGEDGLLGICDENGELCHSLALWNGKDSLLKERLYGLTSVEEQQIELMRSEQIQHQLKEVLPPCPSARHLASASLFGGNHGEDVKELYYYQDSSPTHSYMRAMYLYPQAEFPYDKLKYENSLRGRDVPEYEITETGVMNDGFWSVSVEYAKANPHDIMCRYTIRNEGKKAATIHVMPTLWYRNTWSRSTNASNAERSCRMKLISGNRVHCHSQQLGDYTFMVDETAHKVKYIFTENETNLDRWNSKQRKASENTTHAGSGLLQRQYAKDAFHQFIISDVKESVNPENSGTKCAAVVILRVRPRSTATVRCRLFRNDVESVSTFGQQFNSIFKVRRRECDQFYRNIMSQYLTSEEMSITKQAYAGLCWTKQFYLYDGRQSGNGRCWNKSWQHINCHDVISVPDKWEFPWFASWDLALHMLPMSNVDVEFSKSQLLLLLTDRYQHPDGQLPGCEFNFSDMNPPIHAFACLHVYNKTSPRDCDFLKTCFYKLLENFNWWMKAKSWRGSQLFTGGFLGMDNISCIDRSNPPQNATVVQVDGSAWMALFALCMMRMAVELTLVDTDSSKTQLYESHAIDFFNHLIAMGDSLHNSVSGLWDETDKFYYDRLHHVSDESIVTTQSRHESVLRIRSMVGLTPLLAVIHIPHKSLQHLSALVERLNAADARLYKHTCEDGILLSLVCKEKFDCLLRYMLNENEFLARYGVTSLSKYHKEHEFSLKVNNQMYSIGYCPAESNSNMFGGNSNWRGPVWLCMNYLLMNALDVFALSDEYRPLPANLQASPFSQSKSLQEISLGLRRRLAALYLIDPVTSVRPADGGPVTHKDNVLFYEYFNPETGQGLGASHQTGWTSLIACVLHEIADSRVQN